MQLLTFISIISYLVFYTNGFPGRKTETCDVFPPKPYNRSQLDGSQGLYKCPKLTPRSAPPRHIRDLRIDDIQV